MDKFVFLLELIGTVAFAASGSLTAMRRHMDLLGVIVLGVITSVGGGILRDVILGITPPLAFRDPTCTLVAVGVSLLLCIPWIRHSLMHNHRLFDVSLLLMTPSASAYSPSWASGTPWTSRPTAAPIFSCSSAC